LTVFIWNSTCYKLEKIGHIQITILIILPTCISIQVQRNINMWTDKFIQIMKIITLENYCTWIREIFLFSIKKAKLNKMTFIYLRLNKLIYTCWDDNHNCRKTTNREYMYVLTNLMLHPSNDDTNQGLSI